MTPRCLFATQSRAEKQDGKITSCGRAAIFDRTAREARTPPLTSRAMGSTAQDCAQELDSNSAQGYIQ